MFSVNDLQFSRFRCFMIGSEAAIILFTCSGRLRLEFTSERSGFSLYYVNVYMSDNVVS